METNKMKKMMKICIILMATMLLLSACSTKASGVESSEDKMIKIGITQIVEHPALDAAREGFINGLNSQGFEGKIEFINRNAQGDMTTAQLIAGEFVDQNVDMIYAIATPTAQAALNATSEIPIMISAVTDPVAAGLVESNEIPGKNVSGTSDEAPIALQLELLRDLNINAKTIGFLYSSSEKNSEVQLEMLKVEAEKVGIKVEALGITSITEIEQSLDILLDKVDVLYTPTDNMVASSIQLVTHKALNKSVPVLGAEVAHVEGGALVTCGVDYFELGKQTGIMAAKVLNGEDISTLSIQKSNSTTITINKETADALGLTISEELKARSNVIGVN